MTQTVIQILSGFLLTVPFQQRFTGLNGPLRALYLVAVALATLSTGLVVASVAGHHLLFRQHHKAELVTSSDRLAKLGLASLGLTVVGVLGLVFGVSWVKGRPWSPAARRSRSSPCCGCSSHSPCCERPSGNDGESGRGQAAPSLFRAAARLPQTVSRSTRGDARRRRAV